MRENLDRTLADLHHQNFRHLRRVNVSIIFEKRNSIIDVKYPGYYFLPWSWTGFPRALPPFATRRIAVESFEGDLFQVRVAGVGRQCETVMEVNCLDYST